MGHFEKIRVSGDFLTALNEDFVPSREGIIKDGVKKEVKRIFKENQHLSPRDLADKIVERLDDLDFLDLD